MHTTTNIYVHYHTTNFTFLLHFSLLFKHVSLDALYIDTSTPFYFRTATPLPDLPLCSSDVTALQQKGTVTAI